VGFEHVGEVTMATAEASARYVVRLGSLVSLGATATCPRGRIAGSSLCGATQMAEQTQTQTQTQTQIPEHLQEREDEAVVH
jgi:hypothetical protein